MLSLLLLLAAARAAPAFPPLKAENLAGQPVRLPPAATSSPTIVLVGFQHHHQADAESWWPVTRQLAAAGRASWYECAFIGDISPLLRRIVLTTMRLDLRDDDLRASVAPVFIDGGPWRRALELPDREQLALVLFDTQGQVRVVTRGPHSAEAEAHLRALLPE